MWTERAIPSSSVIPASAQNRKERENDDDRPEKRTHGNASHQRQDDQHDKQNENNVHDGHTTPEARNRCPWNLPTENVLRKPEVARKRGLRDSNLVRTADRLGLAEHGFPMRAALELTRFPGQPRGADAQ